MGTSRGEGVRTLAMTMVGLLGLLLGCSSEPAKPATKNTAKDAGQKQGASALRDAAAGDASPSQVGTGTAKDGGSGKVDAAAVDSGPPPAMAAFRLTELYLRDPHFFLSSVDLTDQPLLGMSVNGSLIPDGINKDADGDGFLDLSVLGLFTPLDPAAMTGHMDLFDADCPVNDATHCTKDPQPTLNAALIIENRAQGNCLEPVAGTTSAFMPAISVPAGPCFVTSQAMDLVFNVGGIDVAMTGARIAASYSGGRPPNQLINGLIAGFVTETNAMQAVLPSDVGAPLAGMPLANFLRSQDRDKAQSPNGEDGWWVYFNFVAKPVEYMP